MTPLEALAAAQPRKPKSRHNRARLGVWEFRGGAMRRRLGLSLEKVAREIGMSPSCLHQVEFGRDPLLSTCMKLATFYGCEIRDLWKPKAQRETAFDE
jgi:DNA-binding XRE family transcriptional regulator